MVTPHSPIEATDSACLSAILAGQKAACRNNPIPSAIQRQNRLQQLHQLLLDRQQAIIEAISADFGNRSADETLLAEIMPCLSGLRDTRQRLKKWMKPSRRRIGLAFQPASGQVMYQPLGVVGIIAPWNYPLYMTIGPLTAALAAGNRVMIKMSEHAPRTGQLVKRLLQEIFPEDLVFVALGETDIATAFSRLPFDHILFTGSNSVGRMVMHAAADNLTPVTLELGGKSPAIVSNTVPVRDAAERIAFGKMLNAGQTCVAPDYVLVPRNRFNSFVQAYRHTVKALYPEMAGNPDYTSIINERQLQRLQACLADAESKGAQVIRLFPDSDDRRLGATLILDPTPAMRVMQEEIFGPLLPIVPYDRLDDALDFINARPRPLALYYFGYDRTEQEYVLTHTHSGGVCINDTLLQAAQDDLPFGGVGHSGMGQYHGHEGFLTFSKARTVLRKGRFNGTRMIYPPYGRRIQQWVYRLFIR